MSKKPWQKPLSMVLKAQPQLYDLHAHLLGMGNAGFWIDTILMDEFIMPTHEAFVNKDNDDIREALHPLVWDKENGGFVDGKETARFFYHLVDENVLRRVNGEIIETVEYKDAIKLLKEEIFPPVLVKLLDENIYNDLIHAGLEFKHDFSYDVVLELSDLRKGLGVKESKCEGFVQLAVYEKLGCHLSGRATKFQHWIVFNAREQKFKIVYGIQVNTLRRLITVDKNRPTEAARLARAHITNAFSMCDNEGGPARCADLHGFHGFFTPEFYPRRFALKDSIYSQRLDILAALIDHIIQRYQTCLPPVKYCELSVSVNDLSKAWVLDVLRSVRVYDRQIITPVEISESIPYKIYKATNALSSFSQLVLEGGFPHLEVAFNGPSCSGGASTKPDLPCVTYKFLAGFDRQKVEAPFLINQDEALDFLYISPHKAILSMMNEIKEKKQNPTILTEETDDGAVAGITTTDLLSLEYDDETHVRWSRVVTIPTKLYYLDNSNVEEATVTTNNDDTKMSFGLLLEKLKNLQGCFENKETPWYYDWVVGLDLFGDELGYPYCPFVAPKFINFVHQVRGTNPYFGVRVHCGENVKFASHENPAYRLFVAHMYIVFRCLLFLQQELKYGIRIGHGIAFDHILGAKLNSSKYRKSSVLMAEMRNNAYYLFKKIAFEVNITSNEYLLGQTLRNGDYEQILRIKELFDMKAHITLGTDDDGIWPIEQCSAMHPGHQSLAAEYCRAISTSLFDSEDHLTEAFKTMKNFCFSDRGDKTHETFVEDAEKDRGEDAPHMNTVIVHPDIVRLINQQYTFATPPLDKNPALEKYKIYSEDTSGCERISWINEGSKLRVAFVCICASQRHKTETLHKEYNLLFNLPKDYTKEFNFIYDNWMNIVHSFVRCETGMIPRTQLCSQHEEMIDVICSGQSELKDQAALLKEFPEIAADITFHIYAEKMDVQEIKKVFEEQIIRSNEQINTTSGKRTLRVFTNTEKYVSSYGKRENTMYQVNPNPSKRNENEQNFIYVLCHHASAATAAVYLISERLSEFLNVLTSSTPPVDLPAGGESTPAPPAVNSNDRSNSEGVPVALNDSQTGIDTPPETQLT